MIYHINVLLDNIFVRFDNEVVHQIVRIPMGTNFAPLNGDLMSLKKCLKVRRYNSSKILDLIL
jgi:hypothetical protein